MKVLIGVDPHKASVAVAAVDEVGELIECATFPQNRAGLRALEQWAKRFPERTRAFNRLHGLLRDLLPGGVPGTLSARRAAHILRGIRPQGSSSRVRRRLASEILRDIRTLDRKIANISEG